MSCCVEITDDNLKISKDKEELILNDLKKFFTEVLEKGKSIRWVDECEIINAETLEDAFEEIGYVLCLKDDGFYYLDYMSNEKLGEEEEIFNSIAKHIVKGTYLEYMGGDGDLFRFVFNGEKCEYVSPKIIWE